MLPAEIQSQLANIRLDPDVLEVMLLAEEQAPVPVVHHFGPGIYIREITIPAGAFAIGHAQRHEHTNIIQRGSVVIFGDDGPIHVSGPSFSVGKPGRKVGICLEECVWQNVFPNPDDERDIEKLEERYFCKSPNARQFNSLYLDGMRKYFDEDREDFAVACKELGISEEQVSAESEIELDMVDLPHEYACRVSVRNSPISGRGLFLSVPAKAGDLIAPGRIGNCRTIAGRFVNHSKTPNCEYREIGGSIFLVAKRDIGGSLGGSPGDELTVDYRQSASVGGRLEVQA